MAKKRPSNYIDLPGRGDEDEPIIPGKITPADRVFAMRSKETYVLVNFMPSRKKGAADLWEVEKVDAGSWEPSHVESHPDGPSAYAQARTLAKEAGLSVYFVKDYDRQVIHEVEVKTESNLEVVPASPTDNNM